MKTLLFAIPALTLATACDPTPYAKRDHVTITELEASSVYPAPGVELWVKLIPEGNFVDRCTNNLGGTFYNDGSGLICEVTAP